ncbi:MAG: GntR family transcriptional regulator [Desulfomicrobium sp.]|uniref:GntR family transcriptional regulator n=1 Tax=Hoeflea sp. TaxID=1940281 RepID=UPI0025BAA3D8|nr:GntR family transcriptional regulator [Hoeflea sp.]MBU4528017.1 GntR family transcriptional regulator [Alphaproteobacteria bacterium]MBV1711947.1 GntR family transcriptional regulator [Desulfomicrobium sp.]MBV1785464.1 GntR family transcriptional regulator [Hoeflea sp.]
MSAASKKLEMKVEPLRRDTLPERVYRQVAGLILDGGIAPGQLITIQALAEAFHVSAMPVREALQRLTAANALTIVSGRSIGIPPLTLERLTDLRNVRLQVEGAATSWAASHANEETIAELKRHLHRMEEATASGDTKAYLQANRAFHFAIYHAAQSPTLAGIIENLWLQIGPYLNLLRESGNYVSSNAHHQDIVKALANHDHAAAEAAMAGDINDAFTVLAKVLA